MARRARRTTQLVPLTLASVAALAISTPPTEAHAARRAALAQSQLIEDLNDVYTYPQRTTDHVQAFRFDLGPDAQTGAGLLLLGTPELTFGFGVQRGDLMNRDVFPHDLNHPNLRAVANPFGEALPAALTIADAFIGAQLGAGKLGARLAIGHGGNSNDPAGDQGNVTEVGHTLVRLDAGFSTTGDAPLDLALRVVNSGGARTVNDEDLIDASILEVGLAARGFAPVGNAKLGYLADLAFTTGSATVKNGDLLNEASSTSFALVAGAGPVYNPVENTTLAAYGLLGFQTTSSDPSASVDNDGESNRAMLIPGVHMAADIALRPWLFVRAGMQYGYLMLANSEEETDGEDQTSTNAAVFGWRSGMGVKVGELRVDGTFEQGFLTKGPDFLGGQGNGLLTQLSATYQF